MKISKKILIYCNKVEHAIKVQDLIGELIHKYNGYSNEINNLEIHKYG